MKRSTPVRVQCPTCGPRRIDLHGPQPLCPQCRVTPLHPRGELTEHDGVRSFRGGCTCWPCVLRRVPRCLAEALYGLRLGVPAAADLLREPR